jgi:hypothetical protein
VIDLPLHAVRILDPELVLVGVAAVDAHLLAHGKPRRLDARELRDHLGGGLDLDPEMVHRPRAGATALRQREIDRPPRGEELHVAGLLLHGGGAEERAVELPALVEVGHVHVNVDLGGHRSLLGGHTVG